MPRITGIDKSGHTIGSFVDIGYDATLPPGTLLCDGSPVSRITYASLFAKIGTTWGNGNGTTTFNLPDGRGKFRRGRDHAAGNDPNAGTRTANAAGGATGDAVGSVQTHATAVNGLHDTGHVHPPLSPAVNFYGTQTGVNAGQHNVNTSNQDTFVGSTGAAVAALAGDSETRPLNIYVNTAIVYL